MNCCGKTSVCPARYCQFRSEGGVAVLEFAIILPLMLLITGASLGYGMLFWEEQRIVESIRVGTRTAALCPGGIPAADLSGHVRDAITKFISNGGGDPGNFALRITPLDIPLSGQPDQKGLRVTLTRLNNQASILGFAGLSTSCFSGTSMLEKNNTAEAVSEEGSSDC